MFSEGWTSRSKIASLTLLDERSHRATTFGYVSLYCPLTPGRGLHFGADTDVALMSRQQSYSGYAPSKGRYASPPGRYSAPGRYSGESEGGPRSVDWTNDQHLTSGWVTARVPAYFQIRKNEDRRERLSVTKKADGSLRRGQCPGGGHPARAAGRCVGTRFRGPGHRGRRRAALSPSSTSWKLSAGPQAELRQLLTGADWLGRFQSWKSAAILGPILSPGCYVAFLAESPFVESPLAGASRQDTVAIVCGICEGRDDGR